jgi:hypothetical protein
MQCELVLTGIERGHSLQAAFAMGRGLFHEEEEPSCDVRVIG